MTDALMANDESTGDEKVIIFLQDSERGGIQLYGYDDESEALADLFIHMKAIFEASGKQLQIHTLGKG